MLRALPLLLASVLGAACAFIVACGDRNGLLPPRSATRMDAALEDVRQAVHAGDCEAVGPALVKANNVLVGLPSTVDDRLVERLRQGIDNLQTVAPDECRRTEAGRTTTQLTTTTTTAPERTTTTEKTQTTTTGTQTTTETTTTGTQTSTTTQPTTTTTPPPPADTSGGTPGQGDGG